MTTCSLHLSKLSGVGATTPPESRRTQPLAGTEFYARRIVRLFICDDGPMSWETTLITAGVPALALIVQATLHARHSAQIQAMAHDHSIQIAASERAAESAKDVASHVGRFYREVNSVRARLEDSHYALVKIAEKFGHLDLEEPDPTPLNFASMQEALGQIELFADERVANAARKLLDAMWAWAQTLHAGYPQLGTEYRVGPTDLAAARRNADVAALEFVAVVRQSVTATN